MKALSLFMTGAVVAFGGASAIAQETVGTPVKTSPAVMVQQPTAPAAAAPTVPTAAPVVAVERVKAITPGMALPSNTEVWLSFNQELNSKRCRQGDKFALSVARDVMLGDFIVIPRGTPATGQVSYRTGKGAFGKSAKMEFDLAYIELGGRTIPLNGHYRIEGQGNTGATVGTAVAVGVFSAFVTGRSAVVSQGTEFKAFTRDALPVVLASHDDAPAAPGAAVAPAPAPPEAAAH